MIHIENLDDGLPVFKALGSEIRIKLIQLLLENKEMNMNELASHLGITNGALTSHVKKLEESGIVSIMGEHSGHGNQKVCRVNVDKILIDILPDEADSSSNSYSISIPIGHYFNYSVFPTCGLSTSKNLVGEVDDPRFFAHPNHVNAQILWFGKGYIDYRIPNMLPPGTRLEQLVISFEIGSEAPGVNSDWPSDISFLLNRVKLGTWTSPGDYGDVRGMFTPSWWFPNWNQYGTLKMLVVNRKGTFIDGMKLSDVTTGKLAITPQDDMTFRFQTQEPAANVGGITLFGREFGNYNQDIRVRVNYVAG
ncbi:MAG: winged helix-turn-helix transcriptional regulator [Lachnospiraceae bacterium]|nr:winged helix-turn-helix transcriptional regulator [Lachnospiraceae bacterium]